MQEFLASDRFKLEARLGSGGFGDVYRVFDRNRSTSVALKVLRHLTPESLFRFKQEFRSLSDLSHPNLIKLHELHCVGDQWFFTMELVDGVSFTEHVRSGSSLFVADSASHSIDADQMSTVALSDLSVEARLATLRSQKAQFDIDPNRLRSVLAQLVDGLSALHANGLLHRDLKPSNVLVTKDGRVVILDFGLVAQHATGSVMATHEIVGTPAYMSPEHVASGLVTPASDWYAVGVMLFEALANRPIFESRGLDLLTEKTRADAPPIGDLVDDVPPDLASLCDQLLLRDHARRPAEDGIRRLLATSVPATAAIPSRDVPLVEREPHLAGLWQAYRDVSDGGRPVVVLVHGHPGVGKSSLVREFLQELRARDGDHVVVLTGRCYEQEAVRYRALDSLVDALCRYLRRLPETVVEALLPFDAWALALAFPVLNRVPAVKRAPRRVKDMPEPQELRRRAAAALRELCSRMSDRRRLVLFVDDLQWGDVDSAAIIHDVLRPPDAPPVLWISSYRREERERSRALQEFLNGTNRPEQLDVRLIAVDELSAGAARDLAAQQLPPELGGVAEMIAAESSGSPLFVRELVNYVASNPSRASDKLSLASVIRARAGQLSAAAHRALELIVIAGQPIEHDIVNRIADGDGQPANVDELLREHFVRETHVEDRPLLEPTHDRVREAILETLPTPDRARLHGRLAAELERGSSSIDPDRLALHFLQSGESGKAIQYSVIAAEAAAGALAFDRAGELYRRAVLLLDQSDARRGPLMVRLADALASGGRSGDAGEQYIEALAYVPADQQLELRRRGAEQLLRGGHIDDGLVQLEQVMKALGLRLTRSPKETVLRIILLRAWLRLRGFSFVERAEADLAPPEVLRVDTCWAAALGLSTVDTMKGFEYQARAVLYALRLGEPVRLARALAVEIAHTAADGHSMLPRVRQVTAIASRLAIRVGHRDAEARVLLMSAVASWLMGDWLTSHRQAMEAEAILRGECTGVQWELGTAQIFSVATLGLMGELERMRELWPRFNRDARARGDFYTEAGLTLIVNGYLPQLADDDVPAARRQLQHYLGRWSSRGFHQQHFWASYSMAEFSLFERDPMSALAPIRESIRKGRNALLMRPQTIDISFSHLMGRCAVGAAAQATGAERAALLKETRATTRRLSRTRAPWAIPLAQSLDAAIANIEGDRATALALLREAADGFGSVSMNLYQAAARLMCARLDPAASDQRLAADTWMTSQRIKVPDRMADMCIPGFYEDATSRER